MRQVIPVQRRETRKVVKYIPTYYVIHISYAGHVTVATSNNLHERCDSHELRNDFLCRHGIPGRIEPYVDYLLYFQKLKCIMYVDVI